VTGLVPGAAEIREHLRKIWAEHPDEEIVGIYADGGWTGPRTIEVDGRTVEVVECDSVLDFREHLSQRADGGPPIVLVTNVEQQNLGTDVLARLARRRLFRFDSWSAAMNRFRAHRVDPRLIGERWIADELIRLEGELPAATSGYLDSDTVWRILLARILGLEGEARPSLQGLLRWSSTPENPQRWKTVSPSFRAGLRRWIETSSGNSAAAILDCIEAGFGTDAVPLGLVCQVVYGDEVQKKADALGIAAGRLERFLAGRRLDSSHARAWAAAAAEIAAEAMAKGEKGAFGRWISRTDQIIEEIGASEYAWLSEFSERGWRQRLSTYARELEGAIETSQLSGITAAAMRVSRHEMAAFASDVVRRVEMSRRLLNWLSTRSPNATWPKSLPEAALQYIAEVSWVDWARDTLRGGEAVAELSRAYERLLSRIRGEREEFNRAFAVEFARWTSAPRTDGWIVPIENLISDVVAPIARVAPVLLAVLDGMSVAVFRELLIDLLAKGWLSFLPSSLLEHELGLRARFLAGIAVAPTVTEVCRATLLAGHLVRGPSSTEKVEFQNSPILAGVCRPKRPPILYHKGDLREPGGTELASELREAVADGENRIVAVVINAVDDSLAKSDGVRPQWTLSYLAPFLSALLHEAVNGGRTVIVTSDHGHVLDADTELRRSEFGDRWRSADSAASAEELMIEGPRVLSAAGSQIVVPWSETIRYGTKKNGYHGGITPQEAVVPVAVFVQPGVELNGWVEAPPDDPDWWDLRMIQMETAMPVCAPPQKDLFALGAPEMAAQDVGWIGQLLKSSVYKSQRTAIRRSAPPDVEVRRFLEALTSRGGKLTRQALASRLGLAPLRLESRIAVMQRLLNVDGYRVIASDNESETVELNVELLTKQFDLAKGA
jgi:hypothetical protein